MERLLPLLKRPESPDVRAMGPIERLWGVIRRPGPTFRDIGRRPDAAGPFIIVLLNALIMAAMYIAISSKFTVTMVVNQTTQETADVSVLYTDAGGMFLIAAFLSLLPNMLLGLVYLVVGSAFAHFAFKIMGGNGNKMKTLSVVGYSMMPVVLFRFLAVFIALAAIPSLDVNDAASWANVIQTVYMSGLWSTVDTMTNIAFFWTGLLLVFGIREAHDTSTLWAVVMAVAAMMVLGWTFWQAH